MTTLAAGGTLILKSTFDSKVHSGPDGLNIWSNGPQIKQIVPKQGLLDGESAFGAVDHASNADVKLKVAFNYDVRTHAG